MEAVTGFSKETVERWASVLKEKKFFGNVVIDKAFRDFCSALYATKRYDPLSSMLNTTMRFVDENKDDFPGLSESLVIKVPDTLATSEEHDGLAAEREPNTVGSSEEEVDDCVDSEQLCPTLPTVYYEVKFTCPMTSLLKKRKENDWSLLMTGDAHAEACCYCLISRIFFLSNVTQQSVVVVPAVSSGEASNAPAVQESESRSRGLKRRSESLTVSTSSEEVNNKKFKYEYEGSSLDCEIQEQADMIETQEAKAQMEAYARNLSASTRGTHLHTVGMLLCDDKVSYWYIDASGVVRTSPESTLSIIFDFEKVAAIHVALSCCGTERLGLFPVNVLCPPTNAPNPELGSPASLAGFTIDLTGSEDKTPSR